LADAIWFTLNLAGPALLLGAGLRLVFKGIPVVRYVCLYVLLIMTAGGLRLWLTGFHRLFLGWLVMSLCIGMLLLILQQLWLWGAVGGIVSGLLLGVLSWGGLVGYLSASSALFPSLLPIQISGAVAALVVGLLHIRHRYSKHSVG
jgi:hypothetical protein